MLLSLRAARGLVMGIVLVLASFGGVAAAHADYYYHGHHFHHHRWVHDHNYPHGHYEYY